MEGTRELRVWALAAMLLCLFGTLQAQSGSAVSGHPSSSSQTFVIPLPSRCAKAHKVEVSVGYPAATQEKANEWDISVTINAAECKMYCTYRRKPASGMPNALLTAAPPVATIRVYGELGPTSAVVVVDPAGLAWPDAKSYVALTPTEYGNSSKRRQIPTRVERLAATSNDVSVRLAARIGDYILPVAAAVPLRI